MRSVVSLLKQSMQNVRNMQNKYVVKTFKGKTNC